MPQRDRAGLRGVLEALAAGCLLAVIPSWLWIGSIESFAENRLKALAAVLTILLLLLGELSRHDASRWHRVWTFGAAGFLGILCFFNFGVFRHHNDVRFVNHWEHFHYQLGSKYFPELGYDGLYVASLAAQAESLPDRPLERVIRDLRTNELAPVKRLDSHRDEVVDRFRPDRWKEFLADHRFYVEQNDPAFVPGIRRDHGYNPTPAWTFLARLLSAHLPARPWALGLLSVLDGLLMAIAFLVIFRTYGGRACALSLAIFGFGYGWRYLFMGAFLRLDWLAALVIAICMLERGRPGAAGALFGYASMVRVFPALLLLGPAVLAVRSWLRGERPAWPARLAAGFLGVVALGLVAGSFTGRGPQVWREFSADIRVHARTWSPTIVGLENLVVNGPPLAGELLQGSVPPRWRQSQERAARLRKERLPVTAMLQTAMLALLLVALWQTRSLAQAAILSMVAVYALLSLAPYYWIMLLTLGLRCRIGAALGVLVLSSAMYAFALLGPTMRTEYALVSAGLAPVLLVAMLPGVRQALRRDRGGRGVASEPSGRDGSPPTG